MLAAVRHTSKPRNPGARRRGTPSVVVVGVLTRAYFGHPPFLSVRVVRAAFTT